jgi:hypothetical protein
MAIFDTEGQLSAKVGEELAEEIVDGLLCPVVNIEPTSAGRAAASLLLG